MTMLPDRDAAKENERRASVSPWTSRIIFGNRTGIEELPAWLTPSYLNFRTQVTDSAYPCFFGTQAERNGEMFYSFVAGSDVEQLPSTMTTFLTQSAAHAAEKNNFALFFEPDPEPLTHDAYRAAFWRTLQYLHDHDPLPSGDPEALDPSLPAWEFTFSGTQMFVVGCTPSYRNRRSRNLGPGMVMLFQPRSVFVDLVTKRAIGPTSRGQVRRRLLAWDGVPHHSALGVFGDEDNHEWKQYFLPDDDKPVAGVCPFVGKVPQLTSIDLSPSIVADDDGTRELPDMVALLRHRASTQPDRLAVRFLADGDSRELDLTYAELDRQACCFAAAIRRQTAPGDRAMLLLPTGLDYVVAFFACLYAGVVAVPAYPAEASNEQHLLRLRAMLRDCTPRLLLTDASHEHLVSNLSDHGAPVACDTMLVVRDQAGETDWQPGEMADTAIAFLQYTSGSTSSPKGVMVSHANLMANQAVLRDGFAFVNRDVMVSWLPLHHDMGLIAGLLAPIHGGFPVVLMTPQHFVGGPLRWLKAISHHRGTVIGAPDFAYQLCVDRVGDEQIKQLDLSSLRLAWCGAEPIRLKTMEAFAARFASRGLRASALCPAYGLAEATLMVSGSPPGTGVRAERFSAEGLLRGDAVPAADGVALVDCGMTQPGHRIRVVDPSTLTECPEGRVGEIWFGGPSVGTGYWGNKAATDETFRASLADAPSERYMRTGDLGFLRGGHLFVSGRLKDLIIIRGQNLYPQDIELVVSERVPELRKGRIAAFSAVIGGVETIGLAAEVSAGKLRQSGQDNLFRAISEAVIANLQEPVGVILLLKSGGLPRTSSGKLRRSACAQGWKDGSLNTLATYIRGGEAEADALRGSHAVPAADIERQLARMWEEVLAVPAVGLNDDFFALGGQSLAAGQLTARIATRFEVELPLRFVFEARTVAAQAAQLRGNSGGLPWRPLTGAAADPAESGFPLSHAQEGLWFLWRLEPASDAYNVAVAQRLTGELDVEALAAALRRVVTRHDTLRTRFEEIDGVARQVVGAEPEFGWSELDLTVLAETGRDSVLGQRLRELAAAPFDLERGPLLRAELIRPDARTHVLALVTHHIVSDGWSIAVLLKELAASYAAERQEGAVELAPLPIQYGDYARWQRDRLDGTVLSAQLAYWRETLGSEHPVLRLPVIPARAAKPGAPRSTTAGRVVRTIPGNVSAGLRQLSRAQGATLFMTLLAAFDVLLTRYSGQQDVRVAVPVAGRQRMETEGLIGFFVNTLVIRAELSGAMRFTALLSQVRERILEAQANQDLPFDKLVADLQPERQAGRNPLVQAKFLLQQDWSAAKDFPGLTCEPVDIGHDAARFDIALDVLETKAGLECRFSYAADLFEHAFIERFAQGYVEFASRIVGNADLRVGEIPLAPVLAELLEAPRSGPGILARVATLAAERGSDIALVHDGAEMDWASLWAWSGQLATRLRELGVSAETPVAVCLRRSPALVASLLAIWRAGGIYVPLDPAQPGERSAWQLKDSGARCMVTGETAAWHSAGIVRVDPADVAATSSDVPAALADQAAYIIYTSGSTGRPKGVVVSHGAVTSYLQSLLDRVPAGIASAAYVSTPSADLGHTVLLGALWSGWTLHLMGDELVFDPDGFAAYMREHNVDALKIVPSHLGALLQAATPQDVLPGRCLFVGGEATSAELAARIASLKPRCRVINHYGPTETTVGVITRAGTDTPGAALPLGRPLAHARIHLLDVDGNPAPFGVPGEICVGGASVARGYLNRPGLTADRFLPDTSSAPGSRLYRTGDCGRQLASGEFEFLGRLDDQVKIRGHRVEPGEVAARLRALAGVRDAAVVARADQSGRLRLLGYVTGTSLDVATMRDALATDLPDHMMPAIVILDALPLTSNGKLDRASLPEPDDMAAGGHVAPRDRKEAILARAWQSTLKRERVSVTDNFFALGGDSILTLQVIAKARRGGLKLTPKQAFEHPTIEAAARVAILIEPPPTDPSRPTKTAPVRDFDLAGMTPAELARLDLPLDQIQDIYPATPLQQGMIYHVLLGQQQGAYVNHLRLTLSAGLDPAALRAVWDAAVARHDVLRTSFEWRHGGDVLQIVHRQVTLPYAEHDWSGEDSATYEARLSAWCAEDLTRGIDLGVAPAMRINLFARPGGGYDLIWTRHHALTDGWSNARLLDDMSLDYAARRRGASAALPAPTPYRNYVTWLRQQPSAEAWWRDRLAGLADAALLTECLGRPRQSEPGTQHRRQGLDASLVARLREAARHRRVTLNTLMQGAWAIVLGRLSGRRRVAFGTAVSGRPADLAGVERMVGLFINTLPVAIDVPGDANVAAWLANLQQHNSELRQYEHTSASDLQRFAGVSGDALFDSVIVFQNFPIEVVLKQASGLPITAVETGERTNFPLTLTVFTHDGLTLSWAWDGERVDGESGERLMRHYVDVLEQLSSDADMHVGDVALGDEVQPARLLAGYAFRPVAERIAAQAAAHPARDAVGHDDVRLTFGELDAWSNRIAHRLRRLGVTADERVGLCVARSVELVAGVVGVLKSGGCYVPLDPSYPEERLRLMLEDSGARRVVTDRETAERLRDLFADRELVIASEVPDESSDRVDAAIHPDQLAYVIYTSGSTGRPKGVGISHGALDRFLASMAERPGIAVDDVWLSVTSLSFDISALELLLPLTTGARVEIASRDVVADGRKLSDLVARCGASIMQATPAGWTLLLEGGWSGRPGLKALCGGEAMPADLAAALKACGVELWNMYGPTETTIWSAAGRVDDNQFITLGEAIHDTQLCVVDDSGLAVPMGGVGELCIGGANLARGYLNRPGLTAERFVPSAYGAPGERLYRTGDLCRLRSDGTIEFLGRLDQQIKLRGFRIEPGEIEALLRSQDGVSQAVVAGRKDARGEMRLVAYVVVDAAAAPAPLLASQLREQLKTHLPDHMVPSAVVVLDALPLTPNGKIDRRALPAPETAVEAVAYVAPRTPTEKALAAIWADVLGVEQVGAQDDFYLLGGHSLLAVRVVSRIGRAFARAISLQTLFTHPILADLAAAIDRQVLAPSGPVIAPRPAGQDWLPLSPGQERLWFLWCLEPESPAYNISGALQLDGELDAAALRAALQGLVERHESLRVHVEERDGAAWQVVDAEPGFGWATCNLSTLPAPRRPAKLTQQLEEAAAAPFDLRRGKLLRARLIKLSEREHVLAIAMHHIVSDGWSIAVLLRELAELYAAASASRAVNLPALPVQYGDYALWQRASLNHVEQSAQLAYWRERLGSAHPVLALPVDRARRGPRGTAGGRLVHDLPRDIAAALGRLSQAHRVTLFTTMLAAFDVLLARYSGQRDIRIGVPVAGRRQLETEGLIGFFVNTLVIRAEFDGMTPFGTLLAQVRERVLEAQANQDVPFTRLVEMLQPERHVSHTPLFQTMFSLDPADDRMPDFPGLKVSRLASETGATQFDLTLTVRETPAGLQLSFGYAHDIFDVSTIERIAAHYVEILRGVSRDADLRVGEIELGVRSANVPITYPFRPVVERFAAQAAMRPEAEAIGCEGARLRYGELATWSNRIARRLQRLGVAADERVGLCVERSPGMVAGLLGVLTAGAAFVPLDPAYPAARLRDMLEDAGVRRVVTDRASAGQLSDVLAGCELVIVSEVDDESSDALQIRVLPDQLAYVIYTSGSSGRPKGVAVSHRALSLHVDDFMGRYEITSSDRVLQFSTINFDIATHELLPPLCIGGCTIMRGPEMWDADTLNRHLIEQQVALAFLPTAYWQQWLHRLPKASALPHLRQVTVGGEALPSDALKRWQSGPLSHIRLDNLYGPTETTIAALYRQTGAEDADEVIVPIGRTFPGRSAAVRDADGNVVPAGGYGELCIGGASLARGYLGRPGLTAERFVPDPDGAPGGRLYRSGDLCRQRGDGTTEFLGRLDQQIKLRGFRIELGEIETALRRGAGVSDAVAAVMGEGESRRLIGYVVGAVDIAALREALALQLPEHMVPSEIVSLSSLPLMPNGKVDRAALPEPEARVSSAPVAPRNAAEDALLAVWRGVLKRDDIGVMDNFFALGGDSILSLQVIARAREAGLRLTPKQMFAHPTVAGAAAVAQMVGSIGTESAITGTLPLTPIQARFFARHPDGPAHWNQAVLLRVTGALGAVALETALQALVARHDALRLRFWRTDGVWQQRVAAQDTHRLLEVIDLGDAADWPQRLAAEGTRLQQSLDLGAGPLLRAGYFRLSGGEGRLLIAIHHLAVDGVSWRILLPELQQALGQAERGETIALPSGGTPWSVWVTKLAAYAQGPVVAAELDWWRAALAPASGATLPVDGEGDRTMGASREITFRLDAAATRRLLEQPSRAYRMRPDDVLLTALAQTLAAWSGHAGALIDLEGHGREDVIEDVDLSQTVGWFTTRYPVWIDASAGAGSALVAVKEQLRAVPNKGLHFGLLAQSCDATIAAAIRALPQPAVSFNYLGQFDRNFDGDGRFGFVPESSGRSVSASIPMAHLLDLNGMIVDGKLSLTWRYSPGVLTEATVRRLVDDFAVRVDAMIAHCAAAKPAVTASDFGLAGLTQTELARLGLRLETVQDIYPATPLQQGLIFHGLLSPGQGVYLNQLRFTLAGALDRAALRAAWEAAVARHEVLRTGFEWRHGGEALQVVHRQARLTYVEHDWSTRSTDEYVAALSEWRAADLACDFDLAMAPLMRVNLFARPDGGHDLVWTLHHALMDGWSGAQLLNEIGADYRGRRAGTITALPAQRPYRDYVSWLRQQPSAEAWWRSRLAGAGDSVGLTASLGRPRRIEPGTHRMRQPLDAGLAERLRQAAQRREVTLNTLMQGAWAIVLARFGGRRQVVFGTTVSGRPAELAGVERMLGLFINSLPVWVEVAGESLVTPWLRQLQDLASEMRQYEHTPLSHLQQWTGKSGDALFDSLVVFENYPVDDLLNTEAGGLPVSHVEIHERTHYPLTLTVMPRGGLRLAWEWDGDRVDRDSVACLSEDYVGVLEALAEAGERRIAEIVPRMPAPAPLVSYPFRSVMERVAAQAAAGPEREAVTHDGMSLTYGEIDAWSNRIARRLKRLGVGCDQRVGLCVERSFDLVAGVLGVLKAGGAYVPLDPAYPAERLRYMLEDAGIRQVVADRTSAERLRGLLGERQLVIVSETSDESSEALREPIHPEQLAYVIYTSGSTGQPKGVGVTHRNLARLFDATEDWFVFGPDDVWTLFHSYAFDFSVWELFGALVHGGRLVVVPQAVARDAKAFHALLRRERVTVLNQTPSAFMALMHVDGTADQPADTLRAVIFGGEKLEPAALARWHAARGPSAPTLINMYGITETTVHVTYRPLARSDIDGEAPLSVIGVPIPDLTLHVLGPDMNPVPAGGLGELHVGGAGLARGYLDRAELTAERFVPDPYGPPGARLYRSGDLARRLPNGEIEYIGRNDGQVKIRGFRVELGEIEAVLLGHPDLREAAVVALDDEHGGKRLAAYVVADQTAKIDAHALRFEIEQRLPAHMVPSTFTFLAGLPLTVNGKLDRKALPRPVQTETAHVEPRTDTERALCRIWADVLEVPAVGAEDNFFALGGHSLSAVRASFRLSEELGRDVALAALFAHPTVAALAGHLDASGALADGRSAISLSSLLDGLE